MRSTACLLLALLTFCATARSDETVLERTRAAYAALKSYADTGTLVNEYGSAATPTVEKHRFTTRLRRPRHYFFDFREDAAAGAEQLVIWSDAETFRSWWSTTGVIGVYPKGRGAAAFSLTSFPMRGASLYLAPLLFPEAGLQGPLSVLSDIVSDGEDTIGGHKCLRLKGMQQQAYQTGHRSSPRRTTVWIDAKTYLVRKIVEDTPSDARPGTVQRNVITFEPLIDPPLTDAQFGFHVPTG